MMSHKRASESTRSTNKFENGLERHAKPKYIKNPATHTHERRDYEHTTVSGSVRGGHGVCVCVRMGAVLCEWGGGRGVTSDLDQRERE
jgi:hypothetical protein